MAAVSADFRHAVVAILHSDAITGTSRQLIRAARAAGLAAGKHGAAVEIADQRDMVILRHMEYGGGWQTHYWGRKRAG